MSTTEPLLQDPTAASTATLAGPAARGSARPQRARQVRRPLHGVLLLDKPYGLSSNDALQRAKWLLRADKAGHTGTLDPLATGLLPLCFGAATKFSQVSLDADKRYTATLGLGLTTTSGDVEGRPLQRRPVAVTRAAIAAALAAHTGRLSQTPPMFSALKHEGKALYEYARAGVEVEREARQVTLHSIDVLAWPSDEAMARSVAECSAINVGAASGDNAVVPVPEAFPEVVLDIRCSKGTYIRTLAETIGEMLGCGAHLTALRRTGSGLLDVAQAISLEALQDLPESEREAQLLSPDTLLAAWPSIMLGSDDAGRFVSGLRRRVQHADCDQIRVYGPAVLDAPGSRANPLTQARVLLGSAHVCAGELICHRLLSPPEIAQLSTQPNVQPNVQHIAAPVQIVASLTGAVMNSSTFTSDTRVLALPQPAAVASI
jgi:tRNA pseudouridine55 synthase